MLIQRFIAFAVLVFTALSFAQAPYPQQPIKIIVPFTPGTGMDTIARAVAPKLSERLAQSVIVQNQPGASGNIGADAVAKSAADGYTILMGANTMLMASQMYKNVNFDPVKDFASVSMAAYGTLMLVANPKVGIKSVNELIQMAKQKPGSINFGSPGVGTPHHMAMELFKLESNTFMLHVPYRGSAGYIQDLLAGELNVGFLPVHVAQSQVKAGRLLALAVGSSKRHPVSPDVPTFDEMGVKRIDVDLWYAFFVPAKTPVPIVSRLNTEFMAILRTNEIKELLGRAGLDASASTPQELNQIVVKDYPRWGNVIRSKQIEGE
ncbi:MAG: tripartite tricarboxylate transporter substrate binding protein [Betaproteobacteria bacterium]|jgi:tripartite-type tricarboxylate transporter receptor subunit TctC|nr:tripartite tricarboxylate transporter substrate binding protein [Betaproteobacteria bacterium]NBT68829.1 tripartite tricarboxylate transporter substrate binding protein [Betaproteobacteria bacterium]NBY08376.1 tripartite tricarboxylate transporter substrate binding protein [Betaproteobacteria bacterium]